MKPAHIATRILHPLVWALAALLAGPGHLPGQENPDYPALTAATKAETEYLNAQVAKLKAGADLKTQEGAESKAAKDKKEQETTDAIKAFAALAEKMPSGSYTVADGGIATPRSTLLAYDNLENAANRLKERWVDVVGQKDVIFVRERLPAPGGFESKHYDLIIADIGAEAKRLGISTTRPNALPAAVVLTALPGILNTVAGFFRVDVTEKVFAGKLSDGEAIAVLAGKYAEQRRDHEVTPVKVENQPDPDSTGTTNASAAQSLATASAGTPDAGKLSQENPAVLTKPNAIAGAKQAKAPAVYLSLDDYLFRDDKPLDQTTLGGKIKVLSILDENLAIKIAAIKTGPQDKALADATTAVNNQQTVIDDAEKRRDLVGSIMENAPQQAAAWKPDFEMWSNKFVVEKQKLPALEATQKAAKESLAELTGEKAKYAALRERIAKVFTDFKNTEGSPPLFVRLLRENLLTAIRNKDDFRIISLKVTANPQSMITRKSFWGQQHTDTALVALQFEVSDGSQTLDTGVVYFYLPAPAGAPARASSARPVNKS